LTRFTELTNKPMNRILYLTLYAGLFCISLNAIAQEGQSLPYLNDKLPVDERVKDLISRMTIEEKAAFLDHKAPDIERFKIRGDRWNQSLHGIWWDRPTTMFPVSIAAAATWNPKLVHETAVAMSDEGRAIYNGWHIDPNFQGEKKGLIYRAPVINVSRNPYWGRINECYGEDPFLIGRLGVAYIKGLQGDDPEHLKLAATLKHYAVNNVEKDRMSLNAIVSERMLHEFWLPHFKDCIIEGQAQSIMASYNAINGVPNNVNKLMLTDILKDQWGFQGFVVSDLGGVNTMVRGHEKGKMSFEEAVAKSINAGCDFSDKEYREYLPAAINQGLVKQSRLDDAIARVMRSRFLLGEFDAFEKGKFSKIPMSVIGSAEHIQLALREAQESIVLLKNDGLLPLNKSKIKSLAVVGPHADLFTAGGYSGKPMNPITPVQGIKNRAEKRIEVYSAAGAEIAPPKQQGDAPVVVFDKVKELEKAVALAKQADIAIVCVGTTLAIEAEGRDRSTLGLPGNQEELINAVLAVNPRMIVVLMNAGPLTIPSVKQKAPAIIEAWWGGEQGGNAIADVIFGNVNPGGKLPYTVYALEDQVPAIDEYDVSKGFTYMYLKGKPLFPFGHGLSYTKFGYSDLKLSSPQINSKGALSVSATVKNTGKLKGDEVVQVYVRHTGSKVSRPKIELRGFERITLNPAESKTVQFSIPAEKLAFYDEKQHRFVVEPGSVEILIGSSSEDIRLQSKFRVTN
jgi:beta-glucosidase